MECNEQTELTSKIETDSWMESRLTALGGGTGVGSKGFWQKEKDSWTWTTVMTEEGRGVEVGEGIRGINGNGKIQ